MTNGLDHESSDEPYSPETVKMAITIVVTVPILLVYPFVQRFRQGHGAWRCKELDDLLPGIDRASFLYNIKRIQKEWQ